MAASLQTVIENGLQPIDIRKSKTVFAGAEVILSEALVSYLARWTFGGEKMSFLKLVMLHAIANPLHGGIEENIGADEVTFKDGDYTDQFTKSASNLPGVFIAQYIVNTPDKGLRVPGFSLKDVLLTAGSKMVTRPILKFLYENGPEQNQKYLDHSDSMRNRAREAAE